MAVTKTTRRNNYFATNIFELRHQFLGWDIARNFGTPVLVQRRNYEVHPNAKMVHFWSGHFDLKMGSKIEDYFQNSDEMECWIGHIALLVFCKQYFKLCGVANSCL